jgi:hypothetical protein
VLAAVHPRVWLHVALLILRHVFEPFFVCFARTLKPVVLDADPLFLVDVFLPLSACRVLSVENEAGLNLPNAIAVLATVHPRVWLHVALLLMPVFPRFDLQLLVALLPLREYEDLSLIFCEALSILACYTTLL